MKFPLEKKNQQVNIDKQVTCNNCSLDTICLPRGLSKDEIEEIDIVIKRKKTLQRGEYIYREGEEMKGLLAIKSGTAKLTTNDEHGNEHILDVLLPGELLGFDGLQNSRHSCSVIALETLSICELPVTKLEELAKLVPGLMRELFFHAGEKIKEDCNRIILKDIPAEERLAYFLLNLSSRYNKRGFSATEFQLPLTRHEIGTHLGIALETVSRLLKKLKDEGIIEVDKRNIRILDMQALKQLPSI